MPTDDEGPDAQIGRALRVVRAEHSQQELADAMRDRGWRWTQATVWGVEAGKRPLRLAEARDVAEFLGVAITALVSDGSDSVIASLLRQAEWAERNAWADALDRRSQYARNRMRRQLMQMVAEIRSGAKGPYRVRGLDLEGMIYRLMGQSASEGLENRSIILLELGATAESIGMLIEGPIDVPQITDNSAYNRAEARFRLLDEAIGQRLPMVSFDAGHLIPPTPAAVYVDGLESDWVPEGDESDAT